MSESREHALLVQETPRVLGIERIAQHLDRHLARRLRLLVDRVEDGAHAAVPDLADQAIRSDGAVCAYSTPDADHVTRAPLPAASSDDDATVPLVSISLCQMVPRWALVENGVARAIDCGRVESAGRI